MALIKCNECGQMISDKAKTCPKCGNPLKSDSTLQKRSINKTWILALLGIAAIAFGFISLKLIGNRSNHSDIELLGFDKTVKSLHLWEESERSWTYSFDKNGMLTECVVGGFSSETYVFENGELLSSSYSISSEYSDSGEDETKQIIYSYQQKDDYNYVVYKQEEGSDKLEFTSISYDKQGRVISVGGKTISYGSDNKPFNQNGQYTVIGLELLGVPIINANEFRKEEDGKTYFNENTYQTIEVEYWE